MDTLRTPGGQVKWEKSGDPDGEPVLLIHGSISSDPFAPLMDQPALSGHRIVRHRRRAYSDGFEGPLPVSIEEDADDASALLDALGISRAHLVGHSHGAVVALDLAHRAPERLGALALLEAGLIAHVPSAERAGVVLGRIIEAYADGRAAEAVMEAAAKAREAPVLDAAATSDQRGVTVFIANRSLDEPLSVTVTGLPSNGVATLRRLAGPSPYARNDVGQELLELISEQVSVNDGRLEVTLPPATVAAEVTEDRCSSAASCSDLRRDQPATIRQLDHEVIDRAVESGA